MLVSDLVSDGYLTTAYLKHLRALKTSACLFCIVTKVRWTYVYRTPADSDWFSQFQRKGRHLSRAFCSTKGERVAYFSGGSQRPLLKVRKPHYMFTDYPHALSIREAGSVLGVSRSTIYRLINDGLLDRVYIRSLPRIMSEDVERYLRKLVQDKRVREAGKNPWQ